MMRRAELFLLTAAYRTAPYSTEPCRSETPFRHAMTSKKEREACFDSVQRLHVTTSYPQIVASERSEAHRQGRVAHDIVGRTFAAAPAGARFQWTSPTGRSTDRPTDQTSELAYVRFYLCSDLRQARYILAQTVQTRYTAERIQTGASDGRPPLGSFFLFLVHTSTFFLLRRRNELRAAYLVILSWNTSTLKNTQVALSKLSQRKTGCVVTMETERTWQAITPSTKQMKWIISKSWLSGFLSSRRFPSRFLPSLPRLPLCSVLPRCLLEEESCFQIGPVNSELAAALHIAVRVFLSWRLGIHRQLSLSLSLDPNGASQQFITRQKDLPFTLLIQIRRENLSESWL